MKKQQEPKYKIGQTVWFMKSNKPVSLKIEGVILYSTQFWYGLGTINATYNGFQFDERFKEKELFTTKEALLKSL